LEVLKKGRTEEMKKNVGAIPCGCPL